MPDTRVPITPEAVYRHVLEETRSPALALGLLTTVSVVTAAVLLAAFGWLAVEVQSRGTGPLDVGILHLVYLGHTPALTKLMKVLTTMGAGAFAIPFALAVYGALRWWRRRPRAARLYVYACSSGWAMNLLAKALFRRHRPDVVPHLDAAGWFSFPSGHAMLAPLVFGLAAVLFLREVRSPAVRLISFFAVALLVIGIGVSRVYLGVHYASDVLGALLAGTGWAALCTWLALRGSASR
ncbi:MAG: phosphatase PAP2 family protein [Gemmatimonadota bacterium]